MRWHDPVIEGQTGMTNSLPNSSALRADQHAFGQNGFVGGNQGPIRKEAGRAYTERPAGFEPKPVFATAATAQLFDALGWRVVASSRSGTTYHKPMRCCFVVDGGGRQEAAFGYTGVTAPLDGENPALASAQIRVERFLHHLGEDSGILVQNTPLIAFGGPRRNRLVVFGGWRFHDRYWRPFVLSPEGLGGVSIQTTFFEAQTAPHHLAEIFGVASDKALPKVTEVVRAIESYRGPDYGSVQQAEATSQAGPRLAAGVRIVPFADGWSIAQPGAPAALTRLPRQAPSRASDAKPEAASEKPLVLETKHRPHKGPLNPLAPNGVPWELGEDEFRFRHRQSDRA